MTDENKTPETSFWEKVMQFVSFWLSVLVLITGGLWLYFRSEIEADTEDFIPWAWGKVTGDSLGIFFWLRCFVHVCNHLPLVRL